MKDLNGGPDYSEAGEAKLRAFVEKAVGGKILRMERQVRWRPAWFVDVEVEGRVLPLHLRGDREGNVNIFPDLVREANVIRVLHDQGVAVPRIYGFCEDPPCIVMDAIPGTRNMAEAASDAERLAIGRQYMAEVAKMHRLPVQPFVDEAGVHLPQGAEEIALVGLEAYMPHYLRTKSRPEPMLEFVIGWLRRNVPGHRDKASFIQFDSGQFLFQDGRMTMLYDFEFSMIGDPMVDIATMRMRNSYEPLGDMRVLCKAYDDVADAPIDFDAVDFHTLQFSTLGAMQFTGTVGEPTPGDPHATYLEFDIALRQVILEALGAITGYTYPAEPPPKERKGANAAEYAKLADILERIETVSAFHDSNKEAAGRIIEWLARSDAYGDEMRQRDLADISALLGRPLPDWDEAQAALEAFVRSAGPEHDERLYRLFGAMEGRRMLMFGPTRIGASAAHAGLTPMR